MNEQTAIIDTDVGPHGTDRHRLCAVTRIVRPIDELIRFVAGPEGLVPDLKRKLPGRGVWITGRRQEIMDGIKRGIFARALKADVVVPRDLPELVERLLVRAALDALSIAYKAGQVAAGYAKVDNAIAKGGLAGLIHAAEAGHDGVRKLDAALKRCTRADNQSVAIIRGIRSPELDLALGRANVVHAALLAGRASDTFLARWRDVERFRMVEGDADQWDRKTGSPATVTEQLGME